MSSWPRKIYLLFWLSLIGLTGLAAVLVPRFLDSSQEQGYREIDGQGRPPMVETLTGSVSTSFPVRPFSEEAADLASATPEGPERQAFPGSAESPDDGPDRPAGLPQRDVLGDQDAATPAPSREPVTSRARVVSDASVFESPRTTARVLGTVAPGTQVRWLRTVDGGWEEILLRDGRSVYMQSSSLSLNGAEVVERPDGDTGDERGEGGTELSLLPGTVDSFLANLRDGDLLRASTYLAAGAPPLEEPNLGAWAALVGPASSARVGRMEPVAGRGAEWRSVLVSDASAGLEIQTTWEWEPNQQRWLLSDWQ